MREDLLNKAKAIKSICEQSKECNKCIIGLENCFKQVFTLVPSKCSLEILCKQMEVVESWKGSVEQLWDKVNS